MLSNFLQRVKIAFKVRACLFVDFLVLLFIKSQPQKNTLLLLRLDAIGDYILFRNSFAAIRNSEKYRHCRLILCGNIVWKDLFFAYDKNLADDFIWIDRNKMLSNFFYRFSMQKKIRQLGAEIAIEPTFSRMFLLGDAMIRISGAKQKIGDVGNTDNIILKEKNISDKWFTEFIDSGKEITFEFDRNVNFAKKLCSGNLAVPFSPFPIQPIRQNQIVLFIGASEKYKIWAFENFAQIGKKLFQNYHTKIILLGSKAEAEIAQKIIAFYPEIPFLDLTGKTNLVELANLIAQSTFLITNETAAAHFGVFTHTPTICLANGRHFGRFSPYPNHFSHIKYIFPPQIEEMRHLFEETALKYCNSMGENINEITVENVCERIKDFQIEASSVRKEKEA